MIREVLKELGLDANLQVAPDGESAIVLWDNMAANPRAPCPGLVLLDLNLPRVPGLDVLMRIRKSGRCGSVPVVVVTSSDSAEDVEAVRALNASAYFRKPGGLAEYMALAQVIREALSGWTPPQRP